jgi:hypothetical protein
MTFEVDKNTEMENKRVVSSVKCATQVLHILGVQQTVFKMYSTNW